MTNHVFTPEQIQRTVTILKAVPIRCRDDLKKYDKGARLLDFSGIGKVRGGIIHWLRELSDESFVLLTGIPLHCPPEDEEV